MSHCAFPDPIDFLFSIEPPALPVGLPALPTLPMPALSLPGVPSVPTFAFSIEPPALPVGLPALPTLPGLFCPIP